MRSRLTATLCAAAALALPATATARVLEDPPLHQASPPQPRTVTIVRHNDDTLPIAVASAALLVAMATAGLTIVRRPALRHVE